MSFTFRSCGGRCLSWLCVAAVTVCLTGCPASNTQPIGKPGAGGAGSTSGPTKRIIILTNGNSPFWDAARQGVDSAAKELKLSDEGISAIQEVNDGTIQGQLDKLRQFGSQSDIVAVGVSAIVADNAAIAGELRALKEKGVHVVTIDSDLAPELAEARFAYLGTNNRDGGVALGQTARGLRSGGGEYVTFVGMTGAQNARERVGGFAEGAGEMFKSLDNMGDELDRSRAQENVRNAITNHPGLNVLVGIWSYNAPAICKVVTEQGSRDKYTIVAFDAEPQAIKDMAAGKLDAMVVQNPFRMGYDGVKLLHALHKKDDATIKAMLPNLGSEGGDIVDTGLKVVVPNDQSPLKRDMFAENVEFLTLEQFRKWLDKYGLEGS